MDFKEVLICFMMLMGYDGEMTDAKAAQRPDTAWHHSDSLCPPPMTWGTGAVATCVCLFYAVFTFHHDTVVTFLHFLTPRDLPRKSSLSTHFGNDGVYPLFGTNDNFSGWLKDGANSFFILSGHPVLAP